ncbi:Rhs element Vgr protein [Pseudoduganella plicata]|uniref:Rhs element Vgr protein n=1 Tax=Pseudoduganella plicata TaxID=321984 RepID=A0AA87YAI8_9BURK|nr:Rhs element Vgr protein [Pseudoduganella plicata]GGY83496.1 hypothetical protein GCM10007388_15660 [Pseudoduganella plicata]
MPHPSPPPWSRPIAIVTRTLSPGEIHWCRRLFGGAIDYERVRVHGGSYFWFGLQRRHVAVAPDGEIWFNPEDFSADFSREHAWRLLWFIHEMTHVWQYQLGYPVKWRGALRIGLPYAYELAPHRRLGDFNMEAQGDLLADYFALRFLLAPGAMRQRRYGDALALYDCVLQDFLRAPGDRANLPRSAFSRPFGARRAT